MRSFLVCLVVFPTAISAVQPECRPCAGVRASDPLQLAEALRAGVALEGAGPVVVAFPVSLDGSAGAGGFAALREAGAAPWAQVLVRSPQPIRDNLAELQGELTELARLVTLAGDDPLFQIGWQPREGSFDADDFAFLLKRASVAVTGVDPDARVYAGPLAADLELLERLYDEEIAAYVDGLALSPGAGLNAAVARLEVLDPGKPVAFDALELPSPPERALALAAAQAASGVGATLFAADRPSSSDLDVFRVLATEFAGDLSYDPYLEVEGVDEAWAFVSGEDLSVRLIVDGPPREPPRRLTLVDPQLRDPSSIDPRTGARQPIDGSLRARRGLIVPVGDAEDILLLQVARVTVEELGGEEERLEIAGERQMPVEEILRRLQAFEDDQARRVDHYQARNILHLRFQTGAAGIEAAYEGDFYFERDQGFDWVWENFYVGGVKWRSKKLPELPLIQPEKAAALPLEIHLSKEYRYRLRGTATVDGRDSWVIDFRPTEVVAGRNLHQGTVWVDREIYARVKTRAVQLGLEGDVISNEETVYFSPIDSAGSPAPWSRTSYVLPLRVVGQQLLSVLNATVPLESEAQLSAVRINGDDFESNRKAAWASELTMVRDTASGMRYLRQDEEGGRFVEETIDNDRLFLVGGVFWDESVDFPIPLAGVNYLSLDVKDSGNQVNLFAAGPLLTANFADPRLFGSRWDVGVNLFGFFLDRGDQLYRDGREVPQEEIDSFGGSASLFVGRPIGNFVKLDLGYRIATDDYSRADDTAEDFILPRDTSTHSVSAELRFNRGGYRALVRGSQHRRSDWEFWGLPGNLDFDPAQKEFSRWRASFAKTFWLKKFRNVGFQVQHLDGSDLDRFSRYDFGIFGDASVAGYQGGLVRADSATSLNVDYGINLGDVFRLEIESDAVWATNEDTGLRDELLGGIGLEGSVPLPWQMLTNFELGVAVAGPGEGDISARIVFLKLFSGGKKRRP